MTYVGDSLTSLVHAHACGVAGERANQREDHAHEHQ